MKSSYISTLSWTTSALSTMSRLQGEISKTTTEVATGRHADVGLTLGLKTGQSVSLYATKAAIEAQQKSNTFSSTVVKGAQTVLSQVLTNSNSFLQDLITATSSSGDTKSVASQAEGALSTLIDNLNTSDGQRYLFAGTNSSVAPMVSYDSGPEAAVKSAFATAFGLNPTDPASDPAVANITADQMNTFLDGAFADLFADPSWGATWSNASDQPLTSQVSTTQRANISTTTNTDAVRNLTMALTMVSKLGLTGMAAETQQAVIGKATTLTGAAISQITAESASLGVTQSRISQSNEVLSSANTLVESKITSLEGVDTAEAKTRLDNMTTQLQMSYSTTAKLMQLSLLNYV